MKRRNRCKVCDDKKILATDRARITTFLEVEK